MGTPVDRLRLAETLAHFYWLKQRQNVNADEIAKHWTVPAMRKGIKQLMALPDMKEPA